MHEGQGVAGSLPKDLGAGPLSPSSERHMCQGLHNERGGQVPAFLWPAFQHS